MSEKQPQQPTTSEKNKQNYLEFAEDKIFNKYFNEMFFNNSPFNYRKYNCEISELLGNIPPGAPYGC